MNRKGAWGYHRNRANGCIIKVIREETQNPVPVLTCLKVPPSSAGGEDQTSQNIPNIDSHRDAESHTLSMEASVSTYGALYQVAVVFSNQSR